MDRRTLLTFSFIACLAASLVPHLALAQEVPSAPKASIESFPRVRLGASAGLGIGGAGFAADASARAGVQITSELAVAYQLSYVGTGMIVGDSISWTSNAVLLEWTSPWPGLVLGIGPAVVLGSTNTNCGTAFGSCSPSSRGWVDVGLDARIAIIAGSYGTNARGGFTFQIAFHATPEAIAATLGIGFDLY